MSIKERAQQDVLDQLAWMREHGETPEAYVARYGSVADPEHYGDGGEAIWEADFADLLEKQAELYAIFKEVPRSERDLG